MVAITCLVYEHGARVTTTWAIVSDVDVIVGAGSGQRPDLPGCCACLATMGVFLPITPLKFIIKVLQRWEFFIKLWGISFLFLPEPL